MDGPLFYSQGKNMELRNAIGIDPDAKGFQCALVKSAEARAQQKGYLATTEGLASFIKWVKIQDDIIVAIEGSNGWSLPIEKALRASGTVFYSFKPSDVAKFRKAVLGQNKNNKLDAESTARYAMALEAQGMLENWKRVWRVDEELQGLTRSYAQKVKESTRELNRLWKVLRVASVDLYLALGGHHPDAEISGNTLQNEAVVALLAEKPDIFEWKTFSEADFAAHLGTRNYVGRERLIKELQKVSQSFTPVPAAICLMIKNSADQILLLRRQQHAIKKMLDTLTKENSSVQKLMERQGIGILTSTILIAEIIDIRRFAKNDNLASYSGLGRREYKTGDGGNEYANHFFNPRLKNAFMTAARNVVKFNPDSHLAGYYNNLVKGGMKKTDARKRVARALARVLFKDLYSLIDFNNVNVISEKRDGSDMANGSSRCDRDHSNISSPSHILQHTECVEKIKKEETTTRTNDTAVATGGKRKKSENFA